MPDSGEKTVTEWRIVGSDDTPATAPMEVTNWDALERMVRQKDRQYSHYAPHRVQSRVVTTTEWKDVPDEEA